VPISRLGIYDDWIYFLGNYDANKDGTVGRDDGMTLYRVRIDGTQLAQLSSIAYGYFSDYRIADNWIYYYIDEHNTVYRLRLDANYPAEAIVQSDGGFGISGDALYYVSNGKLLTRSRH
jgi:hypothetical protein